MKNQLSKCLILLMSFLQTENLFTQIENIIKLSPVNTSQTRPNRLGINVKDRFGNNYDLSELRLNTHSSISTGANPSATGSFNLASLDSCSVGKFCIYFLKDNPNYGFDSAVYRAVICEVFKDVQRLLKDTIVPNVDKIRIFLGSDQSMPKSPLQVALSTGVDIVGTGFDLVKMKTKNAWLDNSIYHSYNRGRSIYRNINGAEGVIPITYNLIDGFLIVNFANNKNWYWNYLDTVNITSTVDDLYTHTLHQVLHMLGITSNIDSAGNSLNSYGTNLYSRFTNSLYKNQTSNKLYTYNAVTKLLTKTNTFTVGCSLDSVIYNSANVSNLKMYNDVPFNKNFNLSHFGCTGTGICNTTYAKPANQYVMVPCLGSGQTYIKRHPHQNEVYALCDLGYKLRTVGGVLAYGSSIANNDTLGRVYKTYSSCTPNCVAVGGHDEYLMTTISPFKGIFASSILANDMPANSVIIRMELLDTSYGSLTYNSDSFTFTPNLNLQPGQEVTLAYYPQCNASAMLGTLTYITIKYPYPPLEPCVPSSHCNYICYGTFEETGDPMFWNNFNIYEDVEGVHNSPDLYRTINGITCYRNIFENFWHGCNIDYNSPCGINPKLVKPHKDGGNQFMGLYMVDETPIPYSEGVHFKLRKPIFRDTTKVFRLKFLARKERTGCPDFPVVVFGDDTMPRPIPNAIRPGKLPNPGFSCAQFCDSMSSALITTDTWHLYSIPIKQPKAGDSFTSIVVYAPPTAFALEGLEYYAHFDNFVLYDSVIPKISIGSNPSNTMPCEDTSYSIDYYVCINNLTGKNSDSIKIQLTLPFGITVDTGSDFNFSGSYTIPPNTISNTICDTIKLKYKLDYTKLSYNKGYDIRASYFSNSYCKEDVSNVVRIYSQNNALTIFKSASKINPQVGDTIIFNIEIYNQSNQFITDLNLIDTVDEALDILITNSFSKSGQVLSLTSWIDSFKTAFGPGYKSFPYSAVVKSNCKIQNCAYLTSPTNACFKAKSCIMLNDSSTGSPVRATINPDSPVWCGNNIPLSTIITNPSGAYQYQWFKNNTIQTNDTLANYLATSNAKYHVLIKKNGCSTKVSKVFDTVFRVNKTIQNPICNQNNGSISYLPKNGKSPYTYNWIPTGSTSNSRLNLSAGTYIITIIDSMGCSYKDTQVLAMTIDTIQYSVTITPSKCSNKNGSINIVPTKGKTPFTYLWSDSSNNSLNDSIVAGTYKVTITSAFGCFKIDSFNVINQNFNINHNGVLVNQPTCNASNGKFKYSPTLGNAPYSYLWSNGHKDSFCDTLKTGTYYVTISDKFGCQVKDTFQMTSFIVNTIQVSDSVIKPTCNSSNGSIILTPSNGTTPYKYLWSDGDTSNPKINISAGIYTVTVSDSFKCQTIKQVIVSNSGSLALTKTVTHSKCNDSHGKIIYLVTGAPAYSYVWSFGNQNAPFRNNLPVGSYYFTVTNTTNGCKFIDSAYIILVNDTIHVSDSIINTICSSYKGEIHLKLTGGTAPFIYNWDSGVDTIPKLNLFNGNYDITISDINGCITTKSYHLTDSIYPISFNEKIRYPSCDTLTGGIILSASGGKFPYLYYWSDNGSQASSRSGLAINSYEVQVWDSLGCYGVDTFIIDTITTILKVYDTLINKSCSFYNGAIYIDSIVGGAWPYTFSWSNGSASQYNIGLDTGSYTVTITDYNGCTITKTYIITELMNTLAIGKAVVHPSCFSSNNGSISLSITGGTTPYFYVWSGAASSNDTVTSLFSGKYAVTVYDNNSCARSDSFTLVNQFNIDLDAYIKSNVNCILDTGNLSAIVIAGCTNCNYLWSTGVSSPIIRPL